MEEEDYFVAEMDVECYNQDFDSVDPDGTKTIQDEDVECDIEFE